MPIIREYLGEWCRSYSLGFALLLVNIRVKIPRLLLENGLLFAKHCDPQVKVSWCKQGKGVCSCWKLDHLITGTCLLQAKLFCLEVPSNFWRNLPHKYKASAQQLQRDKQATSEMWASNFIRIYSRCTHTSMQANQSSQKVSWYVTAGPTIKIVIAFM